MKGYYGYEIQKIMEVIVKIGDVYNADKLINVETCHISGISYFNIGNAGLEFLKDLQQLNLKFKVFTTINPAGFTINGWNSNEDYLKQLEILNILKKFNANLWLTCTPYEFLNIRSKTIHAWSESNAITYINSLLDAWSEKLPGIFVIYVAFIGKIPRFGLYVLENRKPKYLIVLNIKKKLSYIDFGILGKVIASKVGTEIPYVKNLIVSKNYYFKQLFASYATYSTNTFMVIENYTKNFKNYYSFLMSDKFEKIVVDDYDILREVEDSLDEVCHAYFTGCPHLSFEEFLDLIKWFEKNNWPYLEKPLIITTSRFTLSKIDSDLLMKLRKCNVKIYVDTCPVVSKILTSNNIKNLCLNSLKAKFYIEKLHNIKCKLCNEFHVD